MPKTAKRKRQASPSVIDKATLAKEVARILEEKEMTQTEAGYASGEAPSQLSLIVNGKVGGFSSERLIRTITKLGRDVELRISPSKGREGKVRISVK